MKNQNRQEPLKYLFAKYGIDFNEIELLISGEKYTAVMLKDKKIGVCANLAEAIDDDLSRYENLNLDRIADRIFLNAYYNAKFNNGGNDIGQDLLKIIDICSFQKIVMIGNFYPIVAKFKKMNVETAVFDLKNNAPYLIPMKKQKEYLQQADCVILTATTIFNQTFMDITDNTKEGCEIFVLGPSTPMISEMLDYRNIKHLFGTSFSIGDRRVLDSIGNDEGPRMFLKFGNKTMLLDNEIKEMK